MNNEQLSFLEPIEKPKEHKVYDATICHRCCCNRCKYNVEIYPFLSDEEYKEIKDDSCWNCDDCYYYGMDNESLSRNMVRFQCNKFKMSYYYAEIEAKKKKKEL